jgi:hypothetical protein
MMTGNFLLYITLMSILLDTFSELQLILFLFDVSVQIVLLASRL